MRPARANATGNAAKREAVTILLEDHDRRGVAANATASLPSRRGAIVSGLLLGVVEGFTKVLYPEASNIVVFVIMALVLILRPAGLFGKE